MRKKKILFAAAAAAVFTLGALTGCGNSADIGRDAAKEAALNDAGITEADTTRMSVTEDRDDGKKTYDIQFNAGGKEYEYEILASDGRILSSDVDTLSGNGGDNADDGMGTALVPDNGSGDSQSQGTDNGSGAGTDQNGQTQNDSQTQNSGNTGNTSSAGNQSSSQTSGKNSGSPDVAVSIDEAAEIALNRVSGATEQDIKIELDRDDGRYKYEGEIHYNGREYEFEIDANSGTILEWSEERD